MAHQPRLCVGIAPIGSADMRDYGRVELFAKLATQFRDSALRVFRQLLRCHPVLDCGNGFTSLILEIPQQRFELFLKLTGLKLLFTLAVTGQPGALTIQFFFFTPQSESFRLSLTQLRMQAVEELAKLSRLRSQTGSSRLNDCRIESEALRDVDSSRRTRDADLQLVGWPERRFVKSHGRVHHAWRIRAENFERGVMSGNDGEAVRFQKMLGNGNRQDCALFGIRCRTQFIKQD